MIIIDATNMIAGRLASFVAKKALLGEDIAIVNSENSLITGKRASIFADYYKRKERGTYKGPLLPKQPNLLLKRTIRGMLPYKKGRGAEAFKRIKCYNGIPEEFQGKKFEKPKEADVSNSSVQSYITIKELSKYLGAKIE